MYIESLYIANFGSISNFGIDLFEGLNVIEGKNESGKSTLCDFIRFIFYGFAGKSDRENHLSFSSGSAEGSLIINCKGKRYRIERKFSGTKEDLAVIDLDDGSRCFDGKVPGEVFFGLPEKLFCGTVFVGQTAGRKINGREISEAVENLLFSADETVSVKKSLQILDRARTALMHKNKKGGKISEIEDSIEDLERQRFEASEASSGIISLEGSIEDLKTKLRSEEKQAENIRKNLEGFELLESRERKKKLRERETEYQKTVAEEDAFRSEYTRNGFFPDDAYLKSLKDCAEEISRADQKIREVKNQIESLNDEISENRKNKEKIEEQHKNHISRLQFKRNIANSAAIICFLLFIVSVSGAVLMFIGGSHGIGAAVSAIAALTFGGMVSGLVFSSRYLTEIKKTRNNEVCSDDVFAAKLDYIRRELSKANGDREKFKMMLDDLCSKWDITPSAKSLAELKYVIDRNAELSKKSEIRRMVYINLKSEAADVYEPEDDGSDIVLPEGFDPKEARRRQSFLTAKIKIDTEKVHKDEVRLAAMSSANPKPAEITERLTALQYEKNLLVEKCDAYIMAYEKLEEASTKMRAAISPKLSESSGAFMKVITDGKYSDIGVDSGFQLTFRPDTGSGGKMTKGESFMSAGTSDAAYISLRLSLAMLICGSDNLPPIIFDESFSRLDNDRLENMLRLLAASRFQVILLTSLPREADIARQCEKIKLSCIKLG